MSRLGPALHKMSVRAVSDRDDGLSHEPKCDLRASTRKACGHSGRHSAALRRRDIDGFGRNSVFFARMVRPPSGLLDRPSQWFEDTLAGRLFCKFPRKFLSFLLRRVFTERLSMATKQFRSYVCIVVVGFCAARASAVTLFSDNFNINSSASWTKNAFPGANAATQTAEFAFDYSPFGIPPAPGSADTLGLRLRANVPIVGGVEVTTRPGGVLSGLSMSPTGQNFGTNYKAEFYAWSNFFGSANAQGLADNANSEGGTANTLFAVGTSGTVPLVAGNPNAISGSTVDGIAFATTADGGIGSDWRVFPKSGTAVPSTTPNVYAAAPAGSATASSNGDAFYTAKFLTQTAPAVQHTIASAEYGADAADVMAGNMQAGSFGFAWHKVTLTKTGGIVAWDIDDTRIAQYDASALTLGGNNIALGQSDVNGTTARHPALVFTVFDNLVVSDVPPAGLLGDFNSDTKVDAGDYATWRKNNNTNNALANDNGLGTPVGSGHYDLWRGHFGNPPGSGALVGASVPEPSSLLLLIIGVIGCCRLSRARGC